METIKFRIGLSGFAYAVFRNTFDAWEYADRHGGYIACFGGFENAVQLNETLGM
jgi:hypothetical protein